MLTESRYKLPVVSREYSDKSLNSTVGSEEEEPPPRRGRGTPVEYRTDFRERQQETPGAERARDPNHSSEVEHSNGSLTRETTASGNGSPVVGSAAEANGEGASLSKRVSFQSVGDGSFHPSYEVFTPKPEAMGSVYRPPEKRFPSAVAPPSSVSRPNYHDALRRVSVVVYQHIQGCERRLKQMTLAAQRGDDENNGKKRGSGGGSGWAQTVSGANAGGAEPALKAFDPLKAVLFHERHFVSPQYRYTFIRCPYVTGLPGASFTMSEVEEDMQPPSVDAIYEFVRTLFNKACLSSECSLVCLIYVERLMVAASVPLLATTWKPILLCGLLLASKVWQDLSSWNVEFSMVYPQFSLKCINRLEHIFLGQIQWDLYISSSLYAKYYFALRSLAEKKDFRQRYNYVMQIDAPGANLVQERSEAIKEEAARHFSKSL